MDVTPVVQVLEAMPDGPTINLINIQGDVNFGDLNSPFARDFSKIGDINTPFGRDFLDISTFDDHSTNTNNGTGTMEIDKTQANEVQKNNIQAPRIPSFAEVIGIKQAPANGPVETTNVEANKVVNEAPNTNADGKNVGGMDEA